LSKRSCSAACYSLLAFPHDRKPFAIERWVSGLIILQKTFDAAATPIPYIQCYQIPKQVRVVTDFRFCQELFDGWIAASLQSRFELINHLVQSLANGPLATE
jgi:hypothetical protein